MLDVTESEFRDVYLAGPPNPESTQIASVWPSTEVPGRMNAAFL